jgi:hypothetical protein
MLLSRGRQFILTDVYERLGVKFDVGADKDVGKIVEVTATAGGRVVTVTGLLV